LGIRNHARYIIAYYATRTLPTRTLHGTRDANLNHPYPLSQAEEKAAKAEKEKAAKAKKETDAKAQPRPVELSAHRLLLSPHPLTRPHPHPSHSPHTRPPATTFHTPCLSHAKRVLVMAGKATHPPTTQSTRHGPLPHGPAVA
jgi:hypothetical protein